MTRLSNPKIYICPNCSGYLRHCVVTFFHMDGLQRWTDGYTSGLWNGMPGPVVRCPLCPAVFWLEDVEQVGEQRAKPPPMSRLSLLLIHLFGDSDGRLQELRAWEATPRALKDAASAVRLDYQGLCSALQQTAPDATDREVYLRRQIWWLSKDHQRLRTDGTEVTPLPKVPAREATGNMTRLLELFEHDPKQQVERGELLRQLGRFDEAVAVLKAVKPNGYSEVRASRIQRWAQARISTLQFL